MHIQSYFSQQRLYRESSFVIGLYIFHTTFTAGTKWKYFEIKKKPKMAYMSTPEMEQLIKQVQVLDLGKV